MARCTSTQCDVSVVVVVVAAVRHVALNKLTNFVLPRVVRYLYGIQFLAAVALSYVIDPGDVGAHLIYHLHKLQRVNNEALALT